MCDARAVEARPLAPVAWPADGRPGAVWAVALGEALDAASRSPPKHLPRWLPAPVLTQLLAAATTALSAEETLVELVPPPGATVTVVGDTHGQLHDALRLFDVAGGPPDAARMFVFNGDFVDRGAWGVETLALVLAWKIALPHAVCLLRGNHESLFATLNYGFHGELNAKYGATTAATLFKRCLKLFACLPLGARVGRTFICHGGLFRKPPACGRVAAARSAAADEEAASLPLSRLGTLEDLRAAKRGGNNPDGVGASQVAADITWSDPDAADGLRFNEARGIGLVYGPDATAAFLAENALTLVIRSHEGPDAREKREGMGSMQDGWCVDHTTLAGRLATLFSAPDYPQFCAEGDVRCGNRAALAVLRPPHYDEPEILHFDAAPRPEATPFYDLGIGGSDEEGPDGELAAAGGTA